MDTVTVVPEGFVPSEFVKVTWGCVGRAAPTCPPTGSMLTSDVETEKVKLSSPSPVSPELSVELVTKVGSAKDDPVPPYPP